MNYTLTRYNYQDKEIAQRFQRQYQEIFQKIHAKILYEIYASKKYAEGRAQVEIIQVGANYMARAHCSDGAYFETAPWPTKDACGCDVRARCEQWHDEPIITDLTPSEPENPGPDNGVKIKETRGNKKHQNVPCQASQQKTRPYVSRTRKLRLRKLSEYEKTATNLKGDKNAEQNRPDPGRQHRKEDHAHSWPESHA